MRITKLLCPHCGEYFTTTGFVRVDMSCNRCVIEQVVKAPWLFRDNRINQDPKQEDEK